MATDRTPHPLWMTLGLGDEHGPCLALDLHDPTNLIELPDIAHLEDLPPEALVVVDGAHPEIDVRTDGRLLVPRSLFWSLLAPREAGRRRRLVVSDRLVAEQRLRREGRRVWDGVQAWAAIDPDLRARVRALLAPWSRGHALLLDVVEAMAATPGADPFAGWGDETSLPSPPPEAPEPLPHDPLDLEAWMSAPEGLGRLYGEGFRPRPGQGDMARAAAAAQAAGRPLVCEAGTGVGKTLAYLVPLLAARARDGSRCVVSTYTRALQAQILDQDLPRLLPLDPGLNARRLMGRANYLCRTRKLRFGRRPNESLADSWAAAAFELWLAGTVEGMREEVEDHPALGRHLTELFDSPEPCSPAVCYGRDECHVQRARRMAREADLVVVNHALLMNDCAARQTLVGEYRHLVVDEAHRLPQVALDVFAIRCDEARASVLEELVDAVDGGRRPPALPARLATGLERCGEHGATCAEAATAVGESVVRVTNLLRRWLDALGDAHGSVRNADEAGAVGRVRVYDRAETFGPVAEATDELLGACAAVGEAQSRFAAAVEGLDGLPDHLGEDMATLARTAELTLSLEEDLLFLTGIEDEDWVVWLQPDASGRFRAAGATRLDAGGLLREQWLAAGVTPVATSATLGIGEDLAYMSRELGLTRPGAPPDECLVPSPFDIERQSLYLAPSSFPAPDAPGHARALADLVMRLPGETPRKTMVLFTSYRALRAVRDELERDAPDGDAADHVFRTDTARLWREGRPVILAQGSGVSPRELIARFRQERRAILLGTSTFWEGVDLPGRDLEILVVPRLPFLVPTDPWVEARCDRMKARGENPFVEFMVRDAVLRLRQGVGRLLRTESDRGVVVLLDTRLHTKPYGLTFLKALPVPVRFCAGADEAVADAGTFFADG